MKVFKEKEDGLWWFVRALVVLITFLFIHYGFVEESNCNGIDQEFLYCALHPFTWKDWVGCILFFIGVLVFSGVLGLILRPFFGEIYNPTGSSMWNTITFAGVVLGVVLIFA